MRETLEEFPSQLEHLYERMMQIVSNSSSAVYCKCVLALVSIVYRPITLNELSCLVKELDSIAYDPKSIIRVVELCGSFLVIKDSTIYFMHHSVKAYLSTKAAKELFPSGKTKVHCMTISRSLRVVERTL